MSRTSIRAQCCFFFFYSFRDGTEWGFYSDWYAIIQYEFICLKLNIKTEVDIELRCTECEINSLTFLRFTTFKQKNWAAKKSRRFSLFVPALIRRIMLCITPCIVCRESTQFGHEYLSLENKRFSTCYLTENDANERYSDIIHSHRIQRRWVAINQNSMFIHCRTRFAKMGLKYSH